MKLCFISNRFPSILESMLDTLNVYNASAVPPGNFPLDPLANPNYWDHIWSDFGDFELSKTID